MIYTKSELQELLATYSKIDHIYLEGGSYITWRRGTGNNVELLHLKTAKPLEGIGRKLVEQMLVLLRDNPPYATIFGFTRVSNIAAHEFYKKMGFVLSEIDGVYDEGRAMLFSRRYDMLLATHFKQVERTD